MKKLFILLFLSTSLYSDTIQVYTYLIYRQAFFPNDEYANKKKFDTLGILDIKLTRQGQPSEITNYYINYSGKYSLISISPKLATEINIIATLVNDGKIKLIDISDLTNDSGYKTCNVKHINNLPSDFYEVHTTTP